MHGLDPETKSVISDLARQYSLSEDAVTAMLAAIKRGQGTMAQFNIPELGGNGQWMMGGMTMVGDMFNYSLKSTVDGLCGALSQALSSGRIDLPVSSSGGPAWWPQELGTPSSVGAQNDSAYAVFPAARRLAIRDGSGVTVYDTEDHMIGGVGQQQGSNSSLTFSSQRGSFSVSGLRRIDSGPAAQAATDGADPAASWFEQPEKTASYGSAESFAAPAPQPSFEQRTSVPPASAAPAVDGFQTVALIEKLAALRDAGVLTDAEFAAKKAEMLARL